MSLPYTCSEVIRVMVADRSLMNGQLLADALAQDKRLEISGAVCGADAALAAAAGLEPHVALVSAHLDENPRQGFELARQMRLSHPQTRIIILLDASERAAVVEAFRCGARGVFCRTQPLKYLSKCIQSVHLGQVWANSAELRFLLEALAEAAPFRVVDANANALLSKREHEVVRCVAEGMTNREIAERLKLTEHTVKNYLFRIFDKLGVSSRVELVIYTFAMNQSSAGRPETGVHAPSSPERKEPKTAASAVVPVMPRDDQKHRLQPRQR